MVKKSEKVCLQKKGRKEEIFETMGSMSLETPSHRKTSRN